MAETSSNPSLQPEVAVEPDQEDQQSRVCCLRRHIQQWQKQRREDPVSMCSGGHIHDDRAMTLQLETKRQTEMSSLLVVFLGVLLIEMLIENFFIFSDWQKFKVNRISILISGIAQLAFLAISISVARTFAAKIPRSSSVLVFLVGLLNLIHVIYFTHK